MKKNKKNKGNSRPLNNKAVNTMKTSNEFQQSSKENISNNKARNNNSNPKKVKKNSSHQTPQSSNNHDFSNLNGGGGVSKSPKDKKEPVVVNGDKKSPTLGKTKGNQVTLDKEISKNDSRKNKSKVQNESKKNSLNFGKRKAKASKQMNSSPQDKKPRMDVEDDSNEFESSDEENNLYLDEYYRNEDDDVGSLNSSYGFEDDEYEDEDEFDDDDDDEEEEEEQEDDERSYDSNLEFNSSDEDDVYFDSDQASSGYDDSSIDLSMGNFYEDSSAADDDSVYHPPSDYVEDLVIHQGTATKRDLLEHEVVNFDSHSDDMQIIEISCEATYKTIEQPMGYMKDVLVRHNLDFAQKTDVGEVETTNNDCPELVPINDNVDSEDDFSGSSEYDSPMSYDDDVWSVESVNDDDESSLTSSTNLNDKYIMDCHGDISYSVDAKCEKLLAAMQADVISPDLEPDTNTSLKMGSVEIIETSSNNTLDSDLDFIENCGSAVSADVLTVEIADKNIFNDETAAVPEMSDDSIDLEKTKVSQNPFNASPKNNCNVIFGGGEPKTLTTTYAASTSGNQVDVYFFNACSTRHAVALVKDSFYVYGTVNITQIFGQVDIYGYQAKNHKTLSLYSPRGYSAIAIKPVPGSVTTSTNISAHDLALALTDYNIELSSADKESIVEAFNPKNDAIIIMEPNQESAALKQTFAKHMNENVFPHIPSIPKTRPYYCTESILDCMINLKTDTNLLQIPLEWQQVAVEPHSRVLVAGGKSVGKSTFLRSLANRYLSQIDSKRILLIDLDIGQSEIFLPQTISCTILDVPLLGPGFLQRMRPQKAFIVGQTNVVLCANAYLDAVKALLKYCKTNDEFKDLPWLVNTMGYNKGFGLEIIVAISAYLQPTDIVQIESTRDINNFDHWLTPEILKAAAINVFIKDEFLETAREAHNHKLHVFTSAIAQDSRYLREWQMSPKDTRYAMLLCRLSCILNNEMDCFNAATTWSSPYEKLKLVDLLAIDKEQGYEDFLKAFNANLVYLCCDSGGGSALECIDVGIMCGLDFGHKQIFVRPACGNSPALNNVNCLASAEVILPKSVFTKQDLQVSGQIDYVQTTNDDSASKAIKQIYHRPAAFLTGKKQYCDKN